MKIPGLEIFGNKNKHEKPPFLYHGSTTAGIVELNPRERHKPNEEVGARVYATQSPAWAAAHSWDWSSDEGIKLHIDKSGKVVLQVPAQFRARMEVPVYLYKVPSVSFNLTSEEGSGSTYDSGENIVPVDVEKFNSVIEAVQHFGGEVILLE